MKSATKTFPARKCQTCGAALQRRHRQNKFTEEAKEFARRKTCGGKCFALLIGILRRKKGKVKPKKCKYCTSDIPRKTVKTGHPEPPSTYLARTVCSRTCFYQGNGRQRRQTANADKASRPERQCKLCGASYSRGVFGPNRVEGDTTYAKRVYCGQICAGLAKRVHPDMAKAPHAKANKIYQEQAGKIACEVCGAPKEGKARLELHHKDKNPQNNSLDNLQMLCIRCHRKLHAAERKQEDDKLQRRCVGPQCKRQTKTRNMPLCETHYQQWRKRGRLWKIGVPRSLYSPSSASAAKKS